MLRLVADGRTVSSGRELNGEAVDPDTMGLLNSSDALPYSGEIGGSSGDPAFHGDTIGGHYSARRWHDAASSSVAIRSVGIPQLPRLNPLQAPAPEASTAKLELDESWAQARWARILDRIEHRQAHLGLRFWGPPLWLEVTMTGPDSDLWPAISDENHWDWQSSEPCAEVGPLIDEGADDDRLLAAVGRYTMENLILNAVHEIGEWFRFDGRRLFPAHISRGVGPSEGRDIQGNGAVQVQVNFDWRSDLSDAAPVLPLTDPLMGQCLVKGLAESTAASRFTYLPGIAISYDASGPMIGGRRGGEPTRTWRSTWSSSTVEATNAGADELAYEVGRDVHRALVAYEADQICRAFHVDGCRPWRLAAADAPLGAEPPQTAEGSEPLAISITYATGPSAFGPS